MIQLLIKKDKYNDRSHLPHTLSFTASIYIAWRVKCYVGMSRVSDAVTCVSLTRDGQCLVLSSAENMVRLLDKESGDLLGEWVMDKERNFQTVVQKITIWTVSHEKPWNFNRKFSNIASGDRLTYRACVNLMQGYYQLYARCLQFLQTCLPVHIRLKLRALFRDYSWCHYI
jgi:WD40 repeat protein